MLVSSGRKHRSLSSSFTDFVTLGSTSVHMSDGQKQCYTWLCLDQDNFISNVVDSANFELSHIGSIHHLQSTDATKALVSLPLIFHPLNTATVSCQAVPRFLLNKLLKVHESIYPHLVSLIWLHMCWFTNRVQTRFSVIPRSAQNM